MTRRISRTLFLRPPERPERLRTRPAPHPSRAGVLLPPRAAVRLEAYVAAGIVTPKSLDDALHVALATVSGCPAIVSWNFRHIVHFQKIPSYNAVNAVYGYRAIQICSPWEVIAYEDEDL